MVSWCILVYCTRYFCCYISWHLSLWCWRLFHQEMSENGGGGLADGEGPLQLQTEQRGWAVVQQRWNHPGVAAGGGRMVGGVAQRQDGLVPQQLRPGDQTLRWVGPHSRNPPFLSVDFITNISQSTTFWQSYSVATVKNYGSVALFWLSRKGAVWKRKMSLTWFVFQHWNELTKNMIVCRREYDIEMQRFSSETPFWMICFKIHLYIKDVKLMCKMVVFVWIEINRYYVAGYYSALLLRIWLVLTNQFWSPLQRSRRLLKELSWLRTTTVWWVKVLMCSSCQLTWLLVFTDLCTAERFLLSYTFAWH